MESSSMCPNTLSSFERVDGLWFSDGNLVIQTGKKGFKVFRGILASHSTFFDNMFSLPSPKDVPMYEDCPLAIMPDDPDEMEYFLRALFDHSYFLPAPSKTNYPIVAGVFRISHKYDVPTLRRRALRHLSSRFLVCEHDASARDPRFSLFPTADQDHFSACLIEALILFKELGVTWCLPELYTCLATGELDTLLNGVKWAGHSLELESTDILLCFRGRERLMELSLGVADLICIEGLANCSSCDEKRARLTSTVRGWYDSNSRCQLFEDLSASQWKVLQVELCTSCIEHLKRSMKSHRERLWNDLPGLFGLPAWEELKRLKFEELGYVHESEAPAETRV